MRLFFLLLFVFLNWGSSLALPQIGGKIILDSSPVGRYNRAITLEKAGKLPEALYLYRKASPDLREAQAAQKRLEKELSLESEFALPFTKTELFIASYGLCFLWVILSVIGQRKSNVTLKNWSKIFLVVGLLLALPLLPLNLTKRVQVLKATSSFSGPGSSFSKLKEFKAGEVVTIKRKLSGWFQVVNGGAQEVWLPRSATKDL